MGLLDVHQLPRSPHGDDEGLSRPGEARPRRLLRALRKESAGGSDIFEGGGEGLSRRPDRDQRAGRSNVRPLPTTTDTLDPMPEGGRVRVGSIVMGCKDFPGMVEFCLLGTPEPSTVDLRVHGRHINLAPASTGVFPLPRSRTGTYPFDR